MRATIMVELIALIFILIPVCVGAAPPADTGAPLVWMAQYTGRTERSEKIISTQADFRATGDVLFRGRQLPEVDFKKNVAVCVCLGARRTGGHRIVFDTPSISDNKMVISYHEKILSGVTLQAFTQPCAMKIFEKEEGQEVQVTRTADQTEPKRNSNVKNP